MKPMLVVTERSKLGRMLRDAVQMGRGAPSVDALVAYRKKLYELGERLEYEARKAGWARGPS